MILSTRDRRLRLESPQRARPVARRTKRLAVKKRSDYALLQEHLSDELDTAIAVETETINEPTYIPSSKTTSKKTKQRLLKFHKHSQTKQEVSDNKQRNTLDDDGIMNGHSVEDEHVFEDAAISASEGEDDDVDTAATGMHDKMLAAITSLDKNKSFTRSSRTEPAGEVSELNLRPPDGKKIELGDLLGSLERTAEHGELKKKLLRMQKTKKPLDVPLPEPQAERVQRAVAYRETAKEISKWQPIVKKNREAEHLFFPLKQHSFTPAPPSTSAVQLQPASALERDILALMNGPGAQHNISDKKRALSESEEKALKAMDLERALERRHELQKVRALQSYYEQKARRQNKIKSKKYRRLKKKAKERNLMKLVAEGTSEVDPETAKLELEKAEAIRAKERMTLRHHNKSKWAQKVLQRGHKDPVARQALTEQHQLGRQLKQKVRTTTDDNDDDLTSSEDAYSESSPDEVDTQPVAANSENQTNPWLTGESLAKAKDGKRKGRKRKQKETETMENFKAKKISAYRADEDQLLLLNDSEEEHTSDTNSEEDKEQNESEEPNFIKEPISDKHESTHDVSDTTFADQWDDYVEEEATGFQQETLPNGNLSAKAKSVVNLDPSRLISVIENFDEDGDEGKAGGLHRQQNHIAEAFANDDVVAEFIKDKEQEVEESTLKDIDLTLPGWGSWAGHGTVPHQKAQKRIIKKAPPTEPREDTALPHVIIRQKRDKKFEKHQISHLPFPYTSRDQFEKVLCAPIGRHWNTEATFQSMIKPQVTTQMGAMIQPIEMTDEIKKMAKKSGIRQATNRQGQQKHKRTAAT